MDDIISTYQTYLMYKASSSASWTKLYDIKELPDLIGLPEQIDVTTLSDPEREYIPGIRSNEQKTFLCNYNDTGYDTIAALENQDIDLAVWLGADSSGNPDGSYGKFEGVGRVNAAKPGGGVNAAQDMQVVCTMSQGFKKVASA